MFLQTLLNNTILSLKPYSDTADRDATLLLCDTLQKKPVFLYSHPEYILTTQEQNQFEEKIKRRIQGEPIAYILGHQGFWTLDLKVTKDVLIPRPETELLIEILLEKFDNFQKLKIADLGTGSGAIALSLAKEHPDWQVAATDNSQEALAIAQENAHTLNISNVNFFHGDWCEALPSEKFDVIVSNPPYIAENDPHLCHQSLQYEPQSALISGKNGLDAIHQIVIQAKHYLTPNGMLLLEHGSSQARMVKNAMLKANYKEVNCWRDLQGHERMSGGLYTISITPNHTSKIA